MSVPKELKRLHDAVEIAATYIENFGKIEDQDLAELREALNAFDLNGNVRSEPPAIDPKAIGQDILSALNDHQFRGDCTAGEAAEFLQAHDVLTREQLAWALAHARLAVIHERTKQILAVES